MPYPDSLDSETYRRHLCDPELTEEQERVQLGAEIIEHMERLVREAMPSIVADAFAHDLLHEPDRSFIDSRSRAERAGAWYAELVIEMLRDNLTREGQAAFEEMNQ